MQFVLDDLILKQVPKSSIWVSACGTKALTLDENNSTIKLVIKNGSVLHSDDTQPKKLEKIVKLAWGSAEEYYKAGAKKCFKCGTIKPLNAYYSHADMVDGRLNKCKECVKSAVKENPVDYDLTEKGVIRVLYKTQKRNNLLRGHGKLPFSKVEFSDWLYTNGYKHLFDAWVESGYQKMLKPSPDRINSTLGYSFDNLRLVTWGDNLNYASEDKKTGVGSAAYLLKPVGGSLEPNGEVIVEYKSIAMATRFYRTCIYSKVKNGYTTKDGLYWRYL